MNLQCKSEAKYVLACPTSIGVRITPEGRMPVQMSQYFYMQATSAESCQAIHAMARARNTRPLLYHADLGVVT